MRLGLGGRRTPPHRAAGYVLITVGAIVMLLSMPLFVYVAIVGGLIAYVGHSLSR